MPSASELYGGSYLKATDLTPLGKRRIAVIHDAAPETVGQDQKSMLALTLASTAGAVSAKRLLLNKGNMLQCVSAFGDDYSTWIGRNIEIWSENVLFQGRMVPGIKILPAPRSRASSAPPPPPPPQDMPADADPDSGIGEDEIPF